MRVIHAPSTRLLVNAGMRFPICQSQAPLIDVAKASSAIGRLDTVTCRNCLRVLRAKGRS
jgi:hypothetical protein